MEQRHGQHAQQSSIINESENENSSILMPTQVEARFQASDLMGSHLVANPDLYPQADCTIFQTPNRLGF